MNETRINAHRLIGESVREPKQQYSGRIVGVDQSRAEPVLFVIWQDQPGIHRIELTFDELRELSQACEQRETLKSSVTDDEAPDVDAADFRRRVGTR